MQVGAREEEVGTQVDAGVWFGLHEMVPCGWYQSYRVGGTFESC